MQTKNVNANRQYQALVELDTEADQFTLSSLLFIEETLLQLVGVQSPRYAANSMHIAYMLFHMKDYKGAKKRVHDLIPLSPSFCLCFIPTPLNGAYCGHCYLIIVIKGQTII